MLMRKLNAALSLLTTVLLMDHAIFLAVWMLSRGSITKSVGVAPWILAGVVSVHAVISIYLAIIAHRGTEKRKVKNYVKLNRSTIIQRVSGVLMVIFTPLHIASAAGFMHPPKIVHAMVLILFYTIVLAHIAVSGSKACITLGIGNAKFIKIADIVVKIVCAVTLVAALTGFYLYRV